MQRSKNQSVKSIHTDFIMAWIILTCVGYLAGVLAWNSFEFLKLGNLLRHYHFLIDGLLIGFFQWIVIRSKIEKSYKWFIATGIGYFFGWHLYNQFYDSLTGSIILAATVSISQFYVLYFEFKLKFYSFIWIPVLVITWPLALWIQNSIFSYAYFSVIVEEDKVNIIALISTLPEIIIPAIFGAVTISWILSKNSQE